MAKELEETGTDEAKLRSSVSRAYYASYCVARNYMEDVCNTVLPKDVSQHKYVIDYFNGDHGGKKNHRRSQIAENLRRMRTHRVVVDYRDETQVLKTLRNSTQLVLDMSEDVIALIEKGGL